MSAEIRGTTGSTLRSPRSRAHLVCFPQENKLRKRRHVGSGCAIARYSAATRHHFRLYSVLRRGGGGRRDRWTFVTGVRHHDRHRPHRQRVRHRLPLLAAVHACRVRATLLRRHDGGSGRLSQRRGRHRRPCCGVRRRSRDPRRQGNSPLRSSKSPVAARSDRHPYSRRPPPLPATTQRSALAQIGVPSTAWREAFAIFGAMFVGGTAFVRMAAMATSPFTKQARAVAPAQPRIDDRDKPAVKQADPSSRL